MDPLGPAGEGRGEQDRRSEGAALEQQRMDTNRPSKGGARRRARAHARTYGDPRPRLLSVRLLPLPLPHPARRPSWPLKGEGL